MGPQHAHLTHSLRVLSSYRNPKLLSVLCLSFSSGLPFLLTLGTLQAWLKEVGTSNTIIGLFALTTIPYALKFLWAPILDHIAIPILTSKLGQRRSWMFLSQMALLLSLMGLGLTNPSEHIMLTACMAFFVSLCAATQDNVIEAYRIESLDAESMGVGAATSIIGFRLGMWLSGGGALYLASHLSWSMVYTIMSGFTCVGMMAVLVTEEPRPAAYFYPPQRRFESIGQVYRQVFKPAFSTLLQQRHLGIILLFILLFKVGDTVLNMMSIPFLLEIGFAKATIAHVAKSFGICAMIVGGFLGGVLLQRYTIIQNMILSLSLLVLSGLMFAVQAKLGPHLPFLVWTMGIENIACGLSAATLVTFLSRLCKPPFTATHFSFLSSFGSISRVSLSAFSGWLADQLSWDIFFICVALGCIPACFILWWRSEIFRVDSTDEIV